MNFPSQELLLFAYLFRLDCLPLLYFFLYRWEFGYDNLDIKALSFLDHYWRNHRLYALTQGQSPCHSIQKYRIRYICIHLYGLQTYEGILND
tara:strand:+ start:6423 stop:6698 length:276 start_codon:yes stop_codon:yes gene_type:complete